MDIWKKMAHKEKNQPSWMLMAKTVPECRRGIPEYYVLVLQSTRWERKLRSTKDAVRMLLLLVSHKFQSKLPSTPSIIISPIKELFTSGSSEPLSIFMYMCFTPVPKLLISRVISRRMGKSLKYIDYSSTAMGLIFLALWLKNYNHWYLMNKENCMNYSCSVFETSLKLIV